MEDWPNRLLEGEAVMGRAKKLILANLASMTVQLALLGLLSICGLDTWLAIGISKGASWGMFLLHLLMTR
jgi:hypothetical protein